MKLLVDTNIVIDFLEKRANGEQARALFKLAESDEQYECVSSSSVTDILYIITKSMLIKNKELPETERKSNRDVEESARDRLENFMSILHVLTVSEATIHKAFALKWRDTEDALQYVVAKENNVDVIITNNKSDYEASDIKLLTAQEFIDSITPSQN